MLKFNVDERLNITQLSKLINVNLLDNNLFLFSKTIIIFQLKNLKNLKNLIILIKLQNFKYFYNN